MDTLRRVFSSRKFTLVELFTVCSPSSLMLRTHLLSLELFVMFTLYILYIHHSLVFTIKTIKAAVTRVSMQPTNAGIPHGNLIRSIVSRFSEADAKLVS